MSPPAHAPTSDTPESAATRPDAAGAVLSRPITEPRARGLAGSVILPHSQIALVWLIRLRWFAVAGQLLACFVAARVFGAQLPVFGLLGAMAVTVASNLLALGVSRRKAQAVGLIVPWLLLIDTAVLTVMLALAGGPANPFAALYVLHVALAVLVSTRRWVGVMIVASALGYAAVHAWHLPLRYHGAPPAWLAPAGEWFALLLVVALVGYFAGQLTVALRRREEQVAAMRERVLRSDRLAALTTLAAGAAHELGTPLGTIKLVAGELEHRLRRTDTGGQDMLEDVALIRAEVQRCRQILDRMNVQTLDAGQRLARSFTRQQLVEALSHELTPGRARRVEFDAPQAIGPVGAPLDVLVKSLAVLLNNAFDASPENERVSLAVSRDDGCWRFVVTDRGHGVEPGTLPHLGEPFVTTKPPGRGMGLGLFLVRSLAEQLEGTLTIGSELGRGTQASLSLPIEMPTA